MADYDELQQHVQGIADTDSRTSNPMHLPADYSPYPENKTDKSISSFIGSFPGRMANAFRNVSYPTEGIPEGEMFRGASTNEPSIGATFTPSKPISTFGLRQETVGSDEGGSPGGGYTPPRDTGISTQENEAYPKIGASANPEESGTVTMPDGTVRKVGADYWKTSTGPGSLSITPGAGGGIPMGEMEAGGKKYTLPLDMLREIEMSDYNSQVAKAKETQAATDAYIKDKEMREAAGLSPREGMVAWNYLSDPNRVRMTPAQRIEETKGLQDVAKTYVAGEASKENAITRGKADIMEHQLRSADERAKLMQKSEADREKHVLDVARYKLDQARTIADVKKAMADIEKTHGELGLNKLRMGKLTEDIKKSMVDQIVAVRGGLSTKSKMLFEQSKTLPPGPQQQKKHEEALEALYEENAYKNTYQAYKQAGFELPMSLPKIGEAFVIPGTGTKVVWTKNGLMEDSEYQKSLVTREHGRLNGRHTGKNA